MNIKHLQFSSAFAALLLLITSPVKAISIAEYDLQPASGTSLAASSVAGGIIASNLNLINPDNSFNAFGNHFYHNGWDTTFNAGKYYEMSLSSASSFVLDSVGASFSLEQTSSTTSQFWMRSSLDGFSSDLATGLLNASLVTDFSVDLSSLGVISSPISFRWYLTAANGSVRTGFANHELGAAGGGLLDVGQDLVFSGSFVSAPEPSLLALLSLGLVGIGFSARKKIA